MSPEASGEKLRVLVVTDNPPVHDEFQFGFPEPVEVEFAHDSRDAWNRLFDGDNGYSAVVVDLQTGAAGGYALARDMHAAAALESVPIVVLLEREQDAWLARQAGATVSYLKPVTASKVLAGIRAATGS